MVGRGGYDDDDKTKKMGLALALVYNNQMRVGGRNREDVGEEEEGQRGTRMSTWKTSMKTTRMRVRDDDEGKFIGEDVDKELRRGRGTTTWTRSD